MADLSRNFPRNLAGNFWPAALHRASPSIAFQQQHVVRIPWDARCPGLLRAAVHAAVRIACAGFITMITYVLLLTYTAYIPLPLL